MKKRYRAARRAKIRAMGNRESGTLATVAADVGAGGSAAMMESVAELIAQCVERVGH